MPMFLEKFLLGRGLAARHRHNQRIGIIQITQNTLQQTTGAVMRQTEQLLQVWVAVPGNHGIYVFYESNGAEMIWESKQIHKICLPVTLSSRSNRKKLGISGTG